MVVAASCADESEKPASRSYPVVNTYDATDINESGVTLNGEILNLGNGVAAYGFVYSTANITSNRQTDIEQIYFGEKLETGRFTALANRGLKKGTTYNYRAFAVAKTGGIVTLGQQLSFVSQGSTVPKIKEFYPTQASVGDTITIIGSGFSNITDNNIVRFANIQTSWMDVRGDTLQTLVPGATPFSDVNITVEVGQQSAVSEGKFKMLPVTVTSFEPTDVLFGDTVTIHGVNLPTTLNGSVVTILGGPATFISSNRSEMKVRVNATQTTSNVRTLFGVQETILSTPINLVPTKVNSFSPSSARAGATITITGTNFHPTPENNQVYFGGVGGLKGKVLTATNSKLTVEIPNFASSDVTVLVEASFQSSSAASNFHCISEWLKVADFAGSARDDASAFSVGSYGYAGLGREATDGEIKKYWRYDPAANSWSQIANFPVVSSIANYRRICTFATMTVGYVGVGNFPGTSSGTVTRYDPSQNKWDFVTSFPESATNAVSFSINGNGYVGFGSNSRKFLQYEPASNSWIAKADFPGIVRTSANGFSIGSKAYVIGGVGLKDVWVYDAATDQWARKNDLPSSRVYSSAFSLGGKGYIIGGSIDGQSSAEVLVYDPVTDQWTKLVDFPGGPREAGIAFVVGNKAYFGTGRSAPTVYYKDMYEFDPLRP